MYVSAALSTVRMVELGLTVMLNVIRIDADGWRVLTWVESPNPHPRIGVLPLCFFERRDGMSHCSSAQMQVSHVCRCTSSVVGK
jgi:hypothetical protein